MTELRVVGETSWSGCAICDRADEHYHSMEELGRAFAETTGLTIHDSDSQRNWAAAIDLGPSVDLGPSD